MSAQSQIIWILGTSGAGKGTLLERLSGAQPQWQPIRSTLSLCTNIKKSSKSLIVGACRKKNDIELEVAELIREKNTSVLVKTQWEDLEGENCLLALLKASTPGIAHRIIVLWVPCHVTVERLKDDHRPNRRVSKETHAQQCDDRIRTIVSTLSKKGFPIVWINSSDAEYRTFRPKQEDDCM